MGHHYAGPEGLEDMIRTTRAQIADAERCRGDCRAGSPEAATFDRIIRALESLLSLFRALKDLVKPPDR